MSPADRDVLSSLPRSRPTRRSAKRAGTPADETSAAKREAPPKPPSAEAQPVTAKAATTAKVKAPAKAAATTKTRKPQPKAKRPTTPKAAPAATSSPPPPPAGWAAPPVERDASGRGELLGTAVQAVGELAQIGFSYGGRALKQALSRLPKP